MLKLIRKTCTDPVQSSNGYFVHLHSLILLSTGLQCVPKGGTGIETLISRMYILCCLLFSRWFFIAPPQVHSAVFGTLKHG